MRIIGYAFDADIHCIECTEKQFPDIDNENNRDSEDNEIHPIFDHDEDADKEYCGDCLEKLIEDW